MIVHAKCVVCGKEFEYEQKNEFCKQRKIPLIRVPYTALETLTMEDLSLSS